MTNELVQNITGEESTVYNGLADGIIQFMMIKKSPSGIRGLNLTSFTCNSHSPIIVWSLVNFPKQNFPELLLVHFVCLSGISEVKPQYLPSEFPRLEYHIMCVSMAYILFSQPYTARM